MNYSSVGFQGNLRRAFLLLLVCAVAISATDAAPQSDRKEVVGRARQKYYNLRRQGLIEFSTNIKPRWKLLLSGVESNASAVKLLNGLQFSISIDSESKLRTDHHAGMTPPDQKSADSFDRIFKGMDEAVSRFVATWSVFMLTSPFPEIESDYEVVELGSQYRFSQKDGATNVLTITDKDFMIVEIKVSGAGFTASLKPVLQKTAEGLILKGYTANYETPSGVRSTQLIARLDYQEISGLQLPRRVNLDTVYDGKPAQIEWLFTDYQVRVR